MKKGLVVVFMVCLAGSLFAGGQQTGEAGKVELELFLQKTQLREVWDAQVEEFNATNDAGIRVVQTMINPTEAIQVLTTRFASNDAPDVMQHYPTKSAFKLLIVEDRLVDLQNKPYAAYAIPSVVDDIRHKDGSYYAIPITMNMFGIFYNVNKFEEYGLGIPETYAELIALCKRIESLGEVPFIFDDKFTDFPRQQMSVIMALEAPKETWRGIGANEIDPATVPGLRRACQKFLEMREYTEGNTLAVGYEQSVEDFVKGKGLMVMNGIWALPTLNAAEPPFEMSMFPLPADRAEDTRVVGGIDTAYCVCSDTKHPAEADALMDFLCSKERAQHLVDVDGSPGTIKGVVGGAEEIQPLVKATAEKGAAGWVHYNFGAGGDPELERLAQKLVVDKDVDGYIRGLAVMVDNTYESLLQFKQ
ncbi:MAG: extracellular solute-binding protein [Spirochaetales bacterium]|nr:extracellular solute-binding protein [Spirochaetales bacterium]